MNVDCLIVGGGQAGLSLATILAQKQIKTLILEREHRIGDTWRKRPKNMKLFTSRQMSQLPGLTLPGPANGYPGKDEIADYLERYAQFQQLNVMTDVEIVGVKHHQNHFSLTSKDGELFQAPCLVNATGANQSVIIPPITQQLSASIRQFSAANYQASEQFHPEIASVAVVGDGASGRQIAQELAKTMRVTLFCGSPRPLLPHQLFGKDIFWWLSKTGVLFADTHSWLGKVMQKRNPLPCAELSNRRLENFNIQIAQSLAKIEDDLLCDRRGKKYRVDAVVWCVGYQEETAWLTLPQASDMKGFICRSGYKEGGKTPYHGMFIVGRKWLYSRSSELLLGVPKDAARVALRVENYLASFNSAR